METIASQKSIIKQVIYNVLTYYQNKENDTTDGKYRYFAYRIGDDNLTNFEKKSLDNQIILRSKLIDSDAYILLRIMLCIYEKNYFLFDNPTFIQEVYDDNDLNINIDDIRNMITNSETYINKWIEYLNLLVEQDDIEDYTEDDALDKYQNNYDRFGTQIYNLQVYKKVPSILNTKLRKQIVYSVDEMIEMI